MVLAYTGYRREKAIKMAKQIQIQRKPPKPPKDDREGTWPDWTKGGR